MKNKEPQVGDTDWVWSDSVGKEHEVLILEKIGDEAQYDGVRYVCSYFSPAGGRRTGLTVSRARLFKKPEEVVTYQLMTIDLSGAVKVLYTVSDCETLPKSYKGYPHFRGESHFIQKTTLVDGVLKSVDLVKTL